jgi:hypothetical protein
MAWSGGSGEELLAHDAHLGRGNDADADLIALHCEYLDFDGVPDQEFLADLAGKNEHVRFLANGAARMPQLRMREVGEISQVP